MPGHGAALRLRVWIVAGSAVVILAIATGLVVLHELAPRRWPDLARRWSPSVDHVLRAHGIVGVEPHAVRRDTARFAIRTIERSARRGGGFTQRGVHCLVSHAFRCPSDAPDGRSLPGDPAALAALDRLSRSDDIVVRRCVYSSLPRLQEAVPLLERGLAEEDPFAQESAALGVQAREPHERRIFSEATIERLVRLIDASPRPFLVEVTDRDADRSYDPSRAGPRIGLRPAALGEQRAAARHVANAAWLALATIAPGRARPLADRRGLPVELRRSLARTLGAHDEHVDWLRALASDADIDVAAKARIGLARMAWMSPSTLPPEVGVAAWEAIGASGDAPRLLENSSHRAIRLWKAATPEQRSRLEAAMPDPARERLRRELAERSAAGR